MKNLITPNNYATKIGVTRQTIYNRIKSGELKTQVIDGVIFIIAAAKKIKKAAMLIVILFAFAGCSKEPLQCESDNIGYLVVTNNSGYTATYMVAASGNSFSKTIAEGETQSNNIAPGTYTFSAVNSVNRQWNTSTTVGTCTSKTIKLIN